MPERRLLFSDASSGLQVYELGDGKHIAIVIVRKSGLTVKARLGYGKGGILASSIYRWRVRTGKKAN